MKNSFRNQNYTKMDTKIEYNEKDLVNLCKVLDEFARTVIEKYKLQIADHRASGNLENSLNSSVEFLQQTEPVIKISINTADYYRYLENGRGPSTGSAGSGKTLRESILDWIRLKGITPRPDADGRLPSVNSLAYLISRKIHQEGYQGDPKISLQRTLDETWIEYKERAERALLQDFNGTIGVQILNKIQNIRL